MATRLRVGLVGFGALGQFLYQQIQEDAIVSKKFQIAFVWNRTKAALLSQEGEGGGGGGEKGRPPVPQEYILDDLDDFTRFKPDFIVEVAHPDISLAYGMKFASYCDYMVGSPSVFSNREFERSVKESIHQRRNGIYIPRGALWGVHDIHSMAQRGTLTGLSLTMKFHPSSLKLKEGVEGSLVPHFNAVKDEEGDQILYEGPLRPLCSLAPNNVNTMACAALAGYTIGFDNTKACLISNKDLHAHIIEIVVLGPDKGDLGKFSVTTKRVNPAAPGAVTGQATFVSFLSSMLQAGGKGDGFHFV